VARQAGVDHQSHFKDMLETLPKLDEAMADPKSDKNMQPEYCKNETRSIKPKICWWWSASVRTWAARRRPSSRKGGEEGMDADWLGGFLCPCHGSTFDFAGRVYKSKPAPDNLEVPPHMYLSDKRILIGEDKKGA
jgi:ubiquinol-cytochrome c reductase iron-sulfur subunit